MNKCTIFYLEVIFLQFALDVLNQQFISDAPQLLFKFVFLIVVNYRYENLIDKTQTVAAHQNIVSVVYSLSKWLQQRMMTVFLFEQLETLHNGYAVFDLPTVILKH